MGKQSLMKLFVAKATEGLNIMTGPDWDDTATQEQGNSQDGYDSADSSND